MPGNRWLHGEDNPTILTDACDGPRRAPEPAFTKSNEACVTEYIGTESYMASVLFKMAKT